MFMNINEFSSISSLFDFTDKILPRFSVVIYKWEATWVSLMFEVRSKPIFSLKWQAFHDFVTDNGADRHNEGCQSAGTQQCSWVGCLWARSFAPLLCWFRLSVSFPYSYWISLLGARCLLSVIAYSLPFSITHLPDERRNGRN